MEVLLIYLLFCIVPLVVVDKLINNKGFDLESFDKEKYLKKLEKSKAVIYVIWFFAGAFYSMTVGSFFWDSYVEDGQEYFHDNVTSLAIFVVISGFIYINYKMKDIKKRIYRFDRYKKQKEIDDAIDLQLKKQELAREKYRLKQEELERKKEEQEAITKSKIKRHRKQVSEYFNLYEIDLKFYDKILEFYNKPYFKHKLNPFNEADYFIIDSPEFKILYDLGMVSQENQFPYFLNIRDWNQLLEVLNKSLYKKDRPIILPDVKLLDELSDGYEFEKYIAYLLDKNEFTQIEVLPMSNDYGVDILAEKSGVKYALQCKYYSQPVGISAIQEVSSGKQHYSAHVGVVVTNNSFTTNAINLAETNGILLWDRRKVLEMSTAN